MSKKSDIQIERFKNMSYQDIKDMSQNKARNLLKQAREAWKQREKELAKASSAKSGNFYSPAYENMKEYYEKNPPRGVSRMKKKSLEKELNKLNDFFNSKTSTVKGTREVMRNQDYRIFGEGENAFGKPAGRPARRMTRDQRKRFWSAYNEFAKGSDTAALAARNYAKVQQALGAIVKSTRKKDIQSIMDRLENVLKQFEDIEAGVEVEDVDPVTELLSGSGDDFY